MNIKMTLMKRYMKKVIEIYIMIDLIDILIS